MADEKTIRQQYTALLSLENMLRQHRRSVEPQELIRKYPELKDICRRRRARRGALDGIGIHV